MRVEMNKKRLLDQSRSLKVALDGKHQNTKHYQQAWDGHRESNLYNAGFVFQRTNALTGFTNTNTGFTKILLLHCCW